MPPKARKVKEVAAARMKEQAEAEVMPLTYNNVDAVKLMPWMTSSRLTTAGKLGKIEAQWNVSAKKFTQTVEVQHNEPFALTPVSETVSAASDSYAKYLTIVHYLRGQLRGQRVLLLAPIENTDFFPFLDLPPELRKMIYDLLFEGRDTIRITTHKPPHKPRRPVTDSFTDRHSKSHSRLKFDTIEGKWLGQRPSPLSILSISKQLRDEVASAICGRMFSFYDLTDLHIWLEAIGNFRVYVRHITITTTWKTLPLTKVRAIFKLLAEAGGIRSVSLSHTALCHGFDGLNLSKTAADFIKAAKTSLKLLHRARVFDKNAVQIPGLLHITTQAEITCHGCRHDQACRGLSCSSRGHGEPGHGFVECKDRERHEKDLEEKLQAAIATAVGIKDA